MSFYKSKFSIMESLRFSLQRTKSYFWFFVGVFFVINLIVGLLGYLSMNLVGILSFLPGLVSVVVAVFFASGLIKISLDISFGQEASFGDLISQYKTFLTYFIAKIFYGAVVTFLFGIALLGVRSFVSFRTVDIVSAYFSAFIALVFVVIGIIMSIRLYFFRYFIVDKKSDPFKALKESFNATKGDTLELLIFNVFLFFINIIFPALAYEFLINNGPVLTLMGVAIVLLSVLVTFPLTMISFAFVYHKLAVFGAELSVQPEQVS